MIVSGWKTGAPNIKTGVGFRLKIKQKDRKLKRIVLSFGIQKLVDGCLKMDLPPGQKVIPQSLN